MPAVRGWSSISRPFSIPMRGNEGAVALVKDAFSLFSIPMRGNERLARGSAPPMVTVRFSIPMRGNETGLPAGGEGSGAAFSIPMRGNEPETLAEGIAAGAPAVFDPHEG